MKKIILAACLAFAAATAFPQTQSVGSNNDHGQNDCQCIGIGIPIQHFGPNKTSNGTGSKGEDIVVTGSESQKSDFRSHGMLYIYYEMLLAELHIKVDAQKGK